MGRIDLQPGAEFASDFLVIRKLGQGGMGAVYEVEQRSTKRRRALKVLHPDLLDEPGFARRFETEATVGAQLDSEHVVEVIAAGTDPVPWLAMELLDGEDLDSFTERTGPLPRGAVREIFDQLCHALGDAHAHGIVHRDLKPENIFLARPRRKGIAVTVKILDFGIAKIVAEMSSTSSRKLGGLGSPLWMAPEQVDPENARITPATDVWALGLIAFRLLTGRCFWKVASIERASWAMLFNETLVLPLVPASARAGELGVGHLLPEGFDRWFERCVVRRPESRFQTAESAYGQLDAILRAHSTAASDSSIGVDTTGQVSMNRAAAGGNGDLELTFAIVSGRSHAEAHLAAICAELARALARPVSPRVLPSYAALKQEVEAGRAQVVWAPPRIAIELEGDGLASIELCSSRGGQVAYHAALFTQHVSPIETLADLRGSHVAWVDANSAAGYLVPRMRIAAEGLDPKTLFGRESFLGSHLAVACAVLDGTADVGATYLSLDARTGRPSSAGWLEAGAAINSAFVLATAGPIPSDAIVLSSRLSAELKATIVAQLMMLPEAAGEAIGRLLGADGFAVAERSHFEVLRGLGGRARG